MRRLMAGLALSVLLAACGQADMSTAPLEVQTEEAAFGDMAQGRAEGGEAPQAAPAPMVPPMDADENARGQSTATPTPGQAGGPTPVLYLAYSYAMGLELPSDRLAGVMDRHIEACQTAGPRLCQLVGSTRSGDPESFMNGSVYLRAEPVWLRTFMAGINAEAEQAGGRVTSRSVGSEDLTRQIVDTEARLRALTSLRDRLQALLRDRPGRLADLLEVERELARVQGELDGITSSLAVMRTRVSMSDLNLSYQSEPRSVGSDTFRPLRDAFAGFLGIVVGGFAAIITIIAGLIPIAIVVVPLAWLILRWRRRRGGRFVNRKAEPTPPPQA